MKKTLVILAALLLTVRAASAQSTDMTATGREMQLDQGRDNITPEQRADMQTQRLTKQLSLSTDQSTRVRAIALAENQEVQVLRGKYTAAGSRKGAGQELKALVDKYDAQLKAVLTAEQATKFDQLRAEQMDKRKEKKDSRVKAKS
ncbi:MAG: hypothetical protein H7Z21_19700 [Hymenobacter sp.]|nr:hypothetical protein [Hymenobacter sp.]